MNTKYLFVFLPFLSVLQASDVKAQTETLTGILIKKDWSKTIESYCAGGSDYYVLLMDNQKEVILDLAAWRKRKIRKKRNQKVEVIGKWETFIKKNQDPYSQQPIHAPSCVKFVVL